MAIFALVLFGANSNAYSKGIVKVQIDKGNVSIKVVSNQDHPIVKAQKGAACDVQATVTESGSVIQVSHKASLLCPRGNDIAITIGSKENAEILLKAGTVTLKSASTAIRDFSMIESIVKAGAIVSDVSELTSKRSGNYVGASAIYRSNSKDDLNKPSLKVSVQAGSIHFQSPK